MEELWAGLASSLWCGELQVTIEVTIEMTVRTISKRIYKQGVDWPGLISMVWRTPNVGTVLVAIEKIIETTIEMTNEWT